MPCRAEPSADRGGVVQGTARVDGSIGWLQVERSDRTYVPSAATTLCARHPP